MMAKEMQLTCMIALHYLLQDQIQQMEDICITQWMQRLVKQLIHYGYMQEQEIMKELEMHQKVYKT